MFTEPLMRPWAIFRRYSEEELKVKMEKTGFRVEQVVRFNRVSRPTWFVSGRILKRKTLRFQSNASI